MRLDCEFNVYLSVHQHWHSPAIEQFLVSLHSLCMFLHARFCLQAHQSSMEDPSESLSLDEELFGSLEKAIALAVQHAEQNGAASSSAPDGTSVEEIAALLQLAELAYTNEEWVEVVKIYTQLQEMGIDLPPFADARLALSFSFLNDPAQALIHAVASYENNPAEAAAYIAMARCCVLMVSLPKTGLRWLQLAAQAINIPHSVLKETKAEIEEIAIQSTSPIQAQGNQILLFHRCAPICGCLRGHHPYQSLFFLTICVGEHEEQYAIPYLKQV